jgi:hypothetical protein
VPPPIGAADRKLADEFDAGGASAFMIAHGRGRPVASCFGVT